MRLSDGSGARPGKIILKKRKNSKRLTLSIGENGKLRVSVPSHISYRDAEALLRSNAGLVDRYLDRVDGIRLRHKSLPVRDISSVASARALITDRCARIAGRIGATYGKVRVKGLNSKWGSCSSRGAISLNIKISRLPEELMDYVITHELVHTRVSGHGAGFWLEMARVMPDSGLLNKKLKAYSPVFI